MHGSRSTTSSCRLALVILTGLELGCWIPGGHAPARGSVGVRTVFFGSSTTAGVGATRPENRWTTLLCRQLGWTEINLGLPGSTLTPTGGSLPAGVERVQQVLDAHPDRVVMMLGANDMVRKVPPEKFRAALHEVLKRLEAGTDASQVILCTPQPNSLTAGIRRPYDEILRDEAGQAGIRCIDVGAQVFPASDRTMLCPDGLHLNDRGHAALASFMVRTLVALGLAPAPSPATGANGAAAANPVTLAR